MSPQHVDHEEAEMALLGNEGGSDHGSDHGSEYEDDSTLEDLEANVKSELGRELCCSVTSQSISSTG